MAEVNKTEADQYAVRFDRNSDGLMDFGDFSLFWNYLQEHVQAPDSVTPRLLDHATAFKHAPRRALSRSEGPTRCRAPVRAPRAC